MAVGCGLNALWDLRPNVLAYRCGQLLSGLSPEAMVDLVDFRYLSDALTRDEALGHPARGGRAARPAVASS